MRHVKTCAYCAENYNLLPTVLVTPLRGELYRTTAEMRVHLPYHWHTIPVTGFRVALKFWRWHLGWEFHRVPTLPVADDTAKYRRDHI